MNRKRTDTLYSFWSGALIICLVLAVFAVIFASVVGNHGKAGDETAETAPPTEMVETAAPETTPPAGAAAASSRAALAETADAGTHYVDAIYFLGDTALNALKTDGVLTGTDSAKQVWVPASGRLTLQDLDGATFHSPVTGNNVPAADIAEVNTPAYIILFPSPDNANMVTEDALTEAYAALISSIQAQSPETRIILSSLTPIAASYAYEDLTNEKIAEINDWIAAAAERAGVKYLDAYAGLLNAQGYLSEEYHDGDGLHLNSAGIQAWLEYVRTHAWE